MIKLQSFSYRRISKLKALKVKDPQNNLYIPRKYQKLRTPSRSVSIVSYPNRLVRLLAPFGIRLRVKGGSFFEHLKKTQPNYSIYRLHLLKNIKRPIYFLKFKKKRNNFYFTVYNTLGEVIYYLSSGRLTYYLFRRKNKKLRSSLFNLQVFVKFMCRALRKKKIFKIHFFFKSRKLYRYHNRRVFFTFLFNGIKLMNFRNPMEYSHCRKQKKKKARRL